MTDKQPGRGILAIAVFALLAGAWFVGKRQGLSEGAKMASDQLSSVEAQALIDQLQESLRNAELDLGETAEAMEVSMARTQTLRNLLNEQMRVNANDAIDLDLYRKIETSQEDRALELESLVWYPSEPTTLQLTLIQWKGRDRMAGELAVSLNYVGDFRVEGAEDSESEPNSDELTIDLDPISFDFRFFQTLLVPIPTDLDQTGSGKSRIQLPHSVTVRVSPAEDGLDALEMKFPWNEVAQ